MTSNENSSIESYKSGVPNLRRIGTHYAVHTRRTFLRLFGKRSDLYEFPVYVVEKEDGTLVQTDYSSNASCQGNGHKKRLEISTRTSQESGTMKVSACDANSPYGLLRRKLRVINIDTETKDQLVRDDIKLNSIG